jgi:hypothetical protein
MRRGSSRHQQSLALSLNTVKAHYTDVETLANGAQNPAAEETHCTKMALIGKACEDQFTQAIGSTGTPSGMTYNLNFDHAWLGNVEPSGNNPTINNLDISEIAPIGLNSAAAASFAQVNNQLIQTVGQLTTVVHNLSQTSLNDIDDFDELSQQDIQDMQHDDEKVLAQACSLTVGAIHQIGLRQSGGQKSFNRETRTCFFCKEPGHIKENCFKLNGSRPRNQPDRFVPGTDSSSSMDRPKGRPFSSVFGKKNNFNGRRNFPGKRLQKPEKSYRTFARTRSNTGGGWKVHALHTEEDVVALPADAEIFACESHLTKLENDDFLFFDLA